MTDKEKINRFNIITYIREQMPNCFDITNGVFANTISTEKCAEELKQLSIENEINVIILEDIVLGYLYRKGYSGEHLKKQVKAASVFFAKSIN